MKGDKTLQVSNNTQIEDLKLAYLDAEEVDGTRDDLSGLRFFCMGKELKNELYLYSYDIASDMVVQAMIKKQQWKLSSVGDGKAEVQERRFWTIHNKQRT